MDTNKINELIDRLEETEAQLYEELGKGSEKIACDFMKEKIPLWSYIRKGNKKYALTAPVIYGMIVPALFMDLCVTIYQATCFPVYGIPKARRGDYIVIDRHHLPYLNALQKLNCIYCAYFNGLIAYVREIAARTEQFWCPIRHARRVRGVHHRYWHFLRYGDGDHLKERWMKLRAELQKEAEHES
ncbi:hypothetical protein [Hydrogenimonas sp. SS33]|uniref:hypothetical protein n=1 Tax=Hydrogenimonas leucolamina TaxID=2954236 RepID=UPI00336BCFD2